VDYSEYVATNFVEPAPEPRFDFAGVGGAVLYFADYDAAVAYYTEVLGPPEYVEGPATRGWRIGPHWLTLLAGGSGSPSNTEVAFELATPAEAERLQQAFVAAGATGADPSDALMYTPVRACPVTDPFGTEIMVYGRRADS